MTAPHERAIARLADRVAYLERVSADQSVALALAAADTDALLAALEHYAAAETWSRRSVHDARWEDFYQEPGDGFDVAREAIEEHRARVTRRPEPPSAPLPAAPLVLGRRLEL